MNNLKFDYCRFHSSFVYKFIDPIFFFSTKSCENDHAIFKYCWFVDFVVVVKVLDMCTKCQKDVNSFIFYNPDYDDDDDDDGLEVKKVVELILVVFITINIWTNSKKK